MSQNSSNQRPYYAETLAFLRGESAPQDAVRLLSASDMYVACDAFLGQTKAHISDRLLPSEYSRNEIARQIEWNSEAKWMPREAWSAAVQLALNGAAQRFDNYHKPALSEWESLDFLLTDIHLSALATRQTVEFFSRGDERFLPMRTDLFQVPAHFGQFLASLLAGKLRPVWIAPIDTADTPGIRDGIYPKYRQRTV